MSRKRKIKSAPGQLSLEDLPGFFPEAPSLPAEATPYQSRRSTAKEAVNKYKVDRLETNKATSERPQNRDIRVHGGNSPVLSLLPQIPVYVPTTFDPCQGIREAKQGWKSNQVPSEIVFDCRHLELAQEYACQPNSGEFFSTKEQYLLGKGGLVNLAVFINLLRCYGTLGKWSQNMFQETGIKPIKDFHFIRPNLNTPVGKLWDVLGMDGLTKKPWRNVWTSDVTEFQSRIITPLLRVNDKNRNDIIKNMERWLAYIVDRIGNPTYYQLLTLISEVVKNLVGHGEKGIFGLSIWPSGQIEIIWSNPIDHLDWWPPEDTADSLANSLLSSNGGGMPYIYEDLLPRYKGLLIINWKTHHLIFHSSRSFEIIGPKPRSDAFLPRSILFNLQLFCKETRNRSSNNVC
ncbi:hypothetical protein [Laspinema olomoucense]|uniref:Uncharacterized protein n=1 Tax=Laspinema olomoucense D3b TaxID=2953688 RepID=A0ABT2NC52_9CYAN|nr:hypothetical protein [Laspinema sp. D3b]MCT7980262.1 hypothetical protein [Laspinema sp. D3b]